MRIIKKIGKKFGVPDRVRTTSRNRGTATNFKTCQILSMPFIKIFMTKFVGQRGQPCSLRLRRSRIDLDGPGFESHREAITCQSWQVALPNIVSDVPCTVTSIYQIYFIYYIRQRSSVCLDCISTSNDGVVSLENHNLFKI